VEIERLDHLVLTVRDISASVAFYTTVLGMEAIRVQNDRHALRFGHQKINLHQLGHEFEPKARQATPGSADLCFLTQTPLADVQAHLHRCNVPIELGPIRREGAEGPIESLYIRDPDGNLLELSNLVKSGGRLSLLRE
jgi:catechol 2,3-dioxygenase-like lactoylglutathione lyase family enzyme